MVFANSFTLSYLPNKDGRGTLFCHKFPEFGCHFVVKKEARSIAFRKCRHWAHSAVLEAKSIDYSRIITNRVEESLYFFQPGFEYY